ncbi:hypothetical protein GGR52DRAFT_533924 [Hypoxylon sp. FL1284]|nr:hypothetical protein GGR52DRAFT_533924 [Hypoxylon sp. FL1284]
MSPMSAPTSTKTPALMLISALAGSRQLLPSAGDDVACSPSITSGMLMYAPASALASSSGDFGSSSPACTRSRSATVTLAGAVAVSGRRLADAPSNLATFAASGSSGIVKDDVSGIATWKPPSASTWPVMPRTRSTPKTMPTWNPGPDTPRGVSVTKSGRVNWPLAPAVTLRSTRAPTPWKPTDRLASLSGFRSFRSPIRSSRSSGKSADATSLPHVRHSTQARAREKVWPRASHEL